MNLAGSRVLITGASGGIGGAVARRLAGAGASLILVGRDGERLAAMIATLPGDAGRHRPLVADLSQSGEAVRAVRLALAGGEAVDMLVNCAGVQNFGFFAEESPADAEALLRTNLLAPLLLINALLPHMEERGGGQIVNVGSIFGSIGFPCFASYSASKFGLRGFSEALRRELADSGVIVTYVAPRYTRTGLNRRSVARMAEALAMAQDDPDQVAEQIVAAIAGDAAERYLGWPEKFFVRVNALLPRLVDRALGRQLARMRPFAIPQPQGESS